MSNQDPLNLADIAKELERTVDNLANCNRRGKSNFPYYKAIYADEILDVCDEVLRTGQPVLWPATVVSVNTLKAKWNQGSKWLRDNNDEAGPLLDAVTTSVVPRIGLRIARRRGAHIPQHYAVVNWRAKVEAFLAESRHTDKLEISCPLAPHEIKEINDLLAPVADLFIVGQLDEEGIVLVHYDPSATPKPTNPGPSQAV